MSVVVTGCSLAATACAHSSCLPYWLTTVCGWLVPGGRVLAWCRTRRPATACRRAPSTARWRSGRQAVARGERVVRGDRLRVAVARTGRQLLPAVAGRLANAVLSTEVTPLETVVPTLVKSAGRPISQIAAAQAMTIQIVPSRVLVARLRIRPCQASQIAPMITTGARNGK